MTKYTEYVWKKSLQNQLQNEGYNVVLDPKCSPIPIPTSNREEEVMICSMFYPNNILNSSLHNINSEKFPNPFCKCGDGHQTAYHILFYCKLVNQQLKDEARCILKSIVGETEFTMENSLILLKASQNEKFMKVISETIKQQMHHLRTSVILFCKVYRNHLVDRA